MILIKEILGLLAGIVSLFAYLPYIISTIKKETRPSRSSWWIWSLVGLLIIFSYYYVGARSTIWVPIVFFIGPFTVAILSMKFGEGSRLNKVDKICLFGSLLSLVISIILKSAALLLFINIFIDFLGYLPTLKKTFLNPTYENKTSWILFFVGSIFNLLAIETFSLPIITYPIYMFIMDVIMLLLLYKKRGALVAPIIKKE